MLERQLARLEEGDSVESVNVERRHLHELRSLGGRPAEFGGPIMHMR